MNIELCNIGIVADSTITMDGLTVITGKNNSGKTTVGKTLYSLLDAVCNIQQKAKNDRAYYIQKQLENVVSSLEFLRLFRVIRLEQDSSLFADYPSIQFFAMRDYRREIPRGEVEEFAHSLERELKSFDISLLESVGEFNSYYKYVKSRNPESEMTLSAFNEQREKAVSMLTKLFCDIDKDIELIDYARESINQSLRVEFSNQIQPIRVHAEESRIKLFDGKSIYFELAIVDDRVTNDGRPVYNTSPLKRVYFIDNPFVLDDNSNRRIMRGVEDAEIDTILNPNRVLSHNDKLRFVLRSAKSPTVLEQTVLDNLQKPVKKQIDEIIPGTFEFSSSGDYYVQDGAKLKVSNLATGSKIFSIIKILLEKGELDETTMLILDEPEAHLHPEWQNVFAETIILLIKELGINVLLTTHSPNFMLALDAYMRKHNLEDKTNFYQTNSLDNGFVQYHCVNDNMGIIYQDFLQYLSEVKILRNKYMRDTGQEL